MVKNRFKSTTCQEKDCAVFPKFRYDNKSYCRLHAPIGSSYGNIVCKAGAFSILCGGRAEYGMPGCRRAIRCKDHSYDCDIKYISGICSECKNHIYAFYRESGVCIICARKTYNLKPQKKFVHGQMFFPQMLGVGFRPIKHNIQLIPREGLLILN